VREAIVPTKPEDRQTKDLAHANRELRAALEECRELLERTQRMLDSRQDNWPAMLAGSQREVAIRTTRSSPVERRKHLRRPESAVEKGA
jgi:hypothetical protein